MKSILEVARSIDLAPEDLELYGPYKAKLRNGALAGKAARGSLVLVSAITPTPAGEGKTTTSIGLAQGLAQIGVRAAVALREPSLGPYLGMKGGGTGGGAVAGRARRTTSTSTSPATSTPCPRAHNLLAALRRQPPAPRQRARARLAPRAVEARRST